MSPVPALTRRIRPLGIAFALYETWRRLPPHQRQQLVFVARRHGPRVAASLIRRRGRVKL